VRPTNFHAVERARAPRPSNAPPPAAGIPLCRAPVPVRGAKAPAPAERCERGEEEPLDEERGARRAAFVGELARDHRAVQRPREAALVEEAAAIEAEERFDELLGPKRRADLDPHVDLVVVEPAQRVRRRRGNAGCAAGPENLLATRDDEP
jgi:hypothetical protein